MLFIIEITLQYQEICQSHKNTHGQLSKDFGIQIDLNQSIMLVSNYFFLKQTVVSDLLLMFKIEEHKIFDKMLRF